MWPAEGADDARIAAVAAGERRLRTKEDGEIVMDG